LHRRLTFRIGKIHIRLIDEDFDVLWA
jgi:hypothetical protein